MVEEKRCNICKCLLTPDNKRVGFLLCLRCTRIYENTRRKKWAAKMNDKDRWASFAYYDAKKRAKQRGISFYMTLDYLKSILPDECPVFKNKFNYTNSASFDNPSIDRILPSEGYTNDNIVIIGRRANMIKNDASLEEIEAVIKWMENHEKMLRMQNIETTGRIWTESSKI